MIDNVCALIRVGDKVLAVGRRKKPGFIGLPGGKVDPGETPVTALVRELFEETGIVAQASQLQEIFTQADETGKVSATFGLNLNSEEFPKEPFTGPEGTPVMLVAPSELMDPARCEFPQYNQALFATL